MTFDTFLPFTKPTIEQDEIDEVVSSMKAGWLTTGPKVAQFEADLADYLKAPIALCLNSATAGLHLALEGMQLKPGGEVITTPMTFVATLNTIVHAGLTPVLVDVSPDDYNIDIDLIEAKITDNTVAIMPVHFAGLPVDLDKIYQLADKYNLRVIEDAAHAIGADYKDQRIGSFGDTQVFSFHPNKNMTSGEGGCITCRDDDLIHYTKVMRFHGIDKDSFNRFSKSGSQHYQVIKPGYKYNMLDIQAAIGIHQLKKLDRFITRRNQLAKRYLEKLADWPEFILPKSPSYSHLHAWHLFAPLVNIKQTKLSRDDFMSAMKQANIGTGLHYEAIHLHPYYQDAFNFKRGDFPNAEAISDNIVSLPMFPGLTNEQQDQVIKSMRDIFDNA